jgi:hypothetical protein
MKIQELVCLLEEDLNLNHPSETREVDQGPGMRFDTIEEYRAHCLSEGRPEFSANLQPECSQDTCKREGRLCVCSQSFKALFSIGMSRLIEGHTDLSKSSIISFLHDITSGPWVLIIVNSGCFSMGLYDHRTKTFVHHEVKKRYTTRRRAGFSQHKLDKAKSVVSAGSMIRREQEMKLIRDFHEAIKGFELHLHNVRCVFWNDNYIFRRLVNESFAEYNVPVTEFGFETQEASREELDRCINALLDTPCSFS